MSYVDLQLFKSYVNTTRAGDLADDTLLQLALDSAELLVNDMTARTFVVTDDTSSNRKFYGNGTTVLDVDDFVTLNTVTDLSGVVDPTTYQTVRVRAGESISQIVRTGVWATSSDVPTVTVNAKWGWTAIPAPVKQACMILAKDILANQQVSFGIAAFTEYAGVRAKDNPQVRLLLAPYNHVALVA